MEMFEFIIIVVTIDIVVVGILAVYASRWIDSWVQTKEEKYLFGHDGEES